MSPASTNAAITLVSETETVMGMLSDLLDRETAAVQMSDFKECSDIQTDKIMMFNRYRNLQDTLKRQSETIRGAGEPVAKRMTDAIERMQVAAKRNAQALEVGHRTMQRLTDRIVRGARASVYAGRQTYNKQGRTSANLQAPLKLKINDVL